MVRCTGRLFRCETFDFFNISKITENLLFFQKMTIPTPNRSQPQDADSDLFVGQSAQYRIDRREKSCEILVNEWKREWLVTRKQLCG